MATHSSVLAWRIPGTGEPGALPSMGSHKVEFKQARGAHARAHTRPLLEPSWRAGVELSVLTEKEKLKIFADCFKVVLIAPF